MPLNQKQREIKTSCEMKLKGSEGGTQRGVWGIRRSRITCETGGISEKRIKLVSHKLAMFSSIQVATDRLVRNVQVHVYSLSSFFEGGY